VTWLGGPGRATLRTRPHLVHGMTTSDRSLDPESGHPGCKVSASDWRDWRDLDEGGRRAGYRRGVAVSGAEGGRIAAAGAAGHGFGITTECGFGRRPSAAWHGSGSARAAPRLLGLHRAVLDAS
jgi:hypothetical protein